VRILVTGAGGQLGAALAPVLADRGHDAVLLDLPELDVTEAFAVEGVFRSAMPDVVIHAAAWTDVDGCERDPDRARAVIVDGTRNVVLGAGKAFVIVISTDYVFGGDTDRAYVESDERHPIQVYGAMKAESEAEALRLSDRVAVTRTAWLYGARVASGERARNFITAILDAASRGPLKVVNDQVGSPTATIDLAPALVDLAEARAPGIFHTVNPGIVSRADLARAALRVAGLDPSLVHDVSTADGPHRPARRPPFAPLEPKAWRAAGFGDLPGWGDALERTIKEMA